MARSLSTSFKEAILAPEIEEVFVLLLTIDHPDLTEPIRISSDNKDEFFVDGIKVRGTISQGKNFIYYPTQIRLPDDGEEIVSSFTIQIDNINQEVMRAIRQLNTPPTVTIQVITASHPNTVEIELSGFQLTNVDADTFVISANLTLKTFTGEPFPGGQMLPSNFAGVF